MATAKVDLSGVPTSVDNQSVVNSASEHSLKHGSSCEHCKRHNCHDKHQCNNGQCFVAAVNLLSMHDENYLNLTGVISQKHKGGLVIAPLSSLYRPPKN